MTTAAPLQPGLAAARFAGGESGFELLDSLSDEELLADEPVVKPPLSPEELAALVHRVQDRTAGLLFTATPTEDLDAIAVAARLIDLSTAMSWRAICTAANRTSAAQRRFIGDEVALSARWSLHRGSAETNTATSVCELPGLIEAVEDGTLTHWHVRALVRELDHTPDLNLEQRQAVALIQLARYAGQDVNRFAKQTRALIMSIDPIAALNRKQAADARRQISSWEEGDGQAAMLLRGPKEKIAATMASLRATAAAQAADGDERTPDQRMFDAAIALLTGGLDKPESWHLDVVMPYAVAQGGDLELAEVPGFGSILPSTARELAECASTARRIAVDDNGHVLAVDDTTPGPAAARAQALAPEPGLQPWVETQLDRLATAPVITRDLRTVSYQINRRLRRFLNARDRTCTFPSCNRPAADTDKDHAIPWPLGPTSVENLGCLCRYHHQAKQASFQIQRLPDGTVRWITRGQQYYDRPPQGF